MSKVDYRGTDNFGKLRCTVTGEIGGVGEIVAQQPVGLLIGASIPYSIVKNNRGRE
jgi:hypothetical protein